MANGGHQQLMTMPIRPMDRGGREPMYSLSGGREPMAGAGLQPIVGENVGQTSANAYNTAVNATGMGMGFTPTTVTPNTVAGTNMTPYQNPFQQQVIDASMADMNRANQMALNNVGAQAGSAFGGDRHAIAEAETNRNFANQAAQMTAGLNQAGYQNAQNMAQFDIGNNFAAQNQNNANNFAANQSMMGGANQLANLSQQGFGYNQKINEGLANTGNAQQNLMQQIINAANGQYGDITGYGQNMLNLPIAAVGGAQFPTTQTNAKQPGLFDYLTLGATSMGGGKIVTSEYWRDVEYAMGPKRPDPPGFEIMDAIHRAAITTLGQGAKIRVTSGQEGDLPQHGSNRHKTGLAADFQVYRPDGTLVNIGDPDALNFASKAAQFGVRGIGAGNEYMSANTFHFDMMPHADYGPNQGPVWGSWAKDNRQALLKAMGLTMGPGQQQPMPGQRQVAQNDNQQPGIMELIGNGLRKGLQNGDLMDRLALGFNTMRLEPDANLAAGIRESMADRRERTATSGAANRSVDVLRNMKGPDGQPIPEALEAANAIEANPGMATPILNSFYQMRASGRLTQQTQRYEFEGNVVTISTLKNNETVVKLNGEEVTDPAKISELVGLAQAFEIEQEARIAGGKTEAQKEAENLVTARKSYRTAVELEGTSVAIIDRILNSPQGLIDGIGPFVGGVQPGSAPFRNLSNEAQDFILNHTQLMGTVFTSVFEALKGGGSITENETNQAKQAAARMNTATSPAVYVEALREYRQRLANAILYRKQEIDGVDPTRTNTELNFEIFPEEL